MSVLVKTNDCNGAEDSISAGDANMLCNETGNRKSKTTIRIETQEA